MITFSKYFLNQTLRTSKKKHIYLPSLLNICKLCFNELNIQREREKYKKCSKIQAKKMKLISGKSNCGTATYCSRCKT